MALSPCIDLRPNQQEHLLAIARRSIETGLTRDRALQLDTAALDDALLAALGVFVTLTRDSALRGCIGALETATPLAQGVADSAYSAAFRDPRFPRLQHDELTHVRIEVSVLSAMEPMQVESRAELLEVLNPGQDGLLLEDGHRRATFLPKVWEQLPEPHVFLAQLLAKAGLDAGHWSDSLRCYRYTSVNFGES